MGGARRRCGVAEDHLGLIGATGLGFFFGGMSSLDDPRRGDEPLPDAETRGDTDLPNDTTARRTGLPLSILPTRRE